MFPNKKTSFGGGVGEVVYVCGGAAADSLGRGDIHQLDGKLCFKEQNLWLEKGNFFMC